ncbi:MAG: Holliday junction branch migration protein RuvA [Clostridia bacterium]|nr:Holliday junction branch migration protein RuvA [Clostridia bacterium]
MFNYIKGSLELKKENYIVVENNGIGYEIGISNNTLCALPNEGEEIKVFTYFQVREDGVSLYGFITMEEKRMFLDLISVSGVGPKMALQILSGAKLNDIGVAIISGDITLLSKIKGCGKKTAERIIVELKDKIDAFGYAMDCDLPLATTQYDEGLIDEAFNILVSLGLNKGEALKIVKSCYKDGNTIEELVQNCLRSIGN